MTKEELLECGRQGSRFYIIAGELPDDFIGKYVPFTYNKEHDTLINEYDHKEYTYHEENGEVLLDVDVDEHGELVIATEPVK